MDTDLHRCLDADCADSAEGFVHHEGTKGFAAALATRPVCSSRASLLEASFVSLWPLVHDLAILASNPARRAHE